MVSGATGGIGSAIANALVDAGWRVSMGSRDIPRAEAAVIPGEYALHVPYDAFDKTGARKWVAETVARFGRLDAVVNCAGVFLPFELDSPEEAEEQLDTMWSVNVKAPLRLLREALPLLRGSDCAHVVNVASLAGIRPGNAGCGYAMTKAALISLTHIIRTKYWDDGIRATALCPGAVDTGMISAIRAQLKHPPSDVTDIAQAVLFLLSLSSRSSVAVLSVNSRGDALW